MSHHLNVIFYVKLHKSVGEKKSGSLSVEVRAG